jgi:hypothetical protein
MKKKTEVENLVLLPFKEVRNTVTGEVSKNKRG